jgi:tetratricopeptide (TPR) repeat protein
MLRTLFVIIFVVASFSAAIAQEHTTTLELPPSDSRSLGASVTDYIISAESSRPTKTLADLYKRGLVREKLGAYENALSAFDSVSSKAIEILNSKDTSKELANEVLPYAIASAYRKGILTHRAVEGSVMKLYKQLEMYQDSDAWINEVLTSLSNLTTEKNMDISPSQYYPLYYARAYNRLGWAYALLNGSAWKRYIIYTPADTITMVDKSMGDLASALSAFDINYSKDGQGDMEGKVEKALSGMTDGSDNYTTYALCFNSFRLPEIRGTVKKQISKTIRETLDTYNSATVISAFNYGRKIFTYEEFMKPETKDVIAGMASLLDEMK